MKKIKLIFSYILFLIFLVVIGATNCKKSDETLIGNWISTDMVDTLVFTSNQDFYKIINGVKDYYIYKISGDSILITYNGINMPYIYIGPPKMRFFQFNGNDLTIDFTSSYYGFRRQIIEFNKN